MNQPRGARKTTEQPDNLPIFVSCYNPCRQETVPVKPLLCCVLFLSACLAQTTAPSTPAGKQKILWSKLESSIGEVDEHLDGVMGVAVEDLTTGDHFFLREDEVFAQASSIKITVLANVYLQAEQGKLKH